MPASVDQWRKEQEKPVEGMDLPEGSSAREIMIEKEVRKTSVGVQLKKKSLCSQETTGDDGGHDNDKEQVRESILLFYFDKRITLGFLQRTLKLLVHRRR